ncbi:MAG: flagellar biosynthesis anti-sigma factor FlgM [Planctomycetales bacterium]|nr:flagellar biosynthesis anti-sigma factor FlgM [Planctomycetales bacterium]MCA9168806.1 flagellar biosynthesis anti-sigma factor FlgM [Planctomycetales bacterium]
MEIYGPGRIDGAQSVRATHHLRAVEPQTTTESIFGSDQIDISPEAEFVSQVNDLPEIRADRVAEIRAQIEAGIYETDAKLDLAVGRLLDEIG